MLLDVVKIETRKKIWAGTPKKHLPKACVAFLEGKYDLVLDPFLLRNAKFVGFENNLLVFKIDRRGVSTVSVWPIDGDAFRISIQNIITRKNIISYDDLFWCFGPDPMGFSVYEETTCCSFSSSRADRYTRRSNYNLGFDDSITEIASWRYNYRDTGTNDAKKLYSDAKLVLEEDLRYLNGDQAARFGGKPVLPNVVIKR